MKIRFASKNSASNFAFDAMTESGSGGDIKTTCALRRKFSGNASSVSKTWFTAPSRFGATMIGVARKRQNQIARIKIFAERAQQTARAFNQHHVKTLLHRADVREDFGELHAFPFAARGQQRRDRRAKMPRIDFIERQRAVHGGAERARVVAAAGANRFERRRVDAAFAQKSRQQRGQHRFAGAGVRAGDEERSASFARHQSGNVAGKPSKPLT